jgi:hypothetical protein
MDQDQSAIMMQPPDQSKYHEILHSMKMMNYRNLKYTQKYQVYKPRGSQSRVTTLQTLKLPTHYPSLKLNHLHPIILPNPSRKLPRDQCVRGERTWIIE